MRVVVALGGNALLRRGEPLTADHQSRNVSIACKALAPIASEHQLVITHGNGPQVGLLALQSASYEEVEVYPLDVLGAQTEGMIGYMIEQEMGNLMPTETAFATILTMVEVDPDDPAFEEPTKPIGPTYSEIVARSLAEEKGWSIAKDGENWRRVVPSPIPHRIFELRPIHWLLEKETVVICAGGGGIPTVYNSEGDLEGNMDKGSWDLFLIKFNSSGTRQMGTSSYDRANGVATDSSGNVYVTGRTNGGLDGNTNAGGYDLFVVK